MKMEKLYKCIYLNYFRESLKQEMKLLKHEVELLPKERRKEALRMRKEQLEQEQVERERGFVERLNESHESAMKRLSDTHKARFIEMCLYLSPSSVSFCHSHNRIYNFTKICLTLYLPLSHTVYPRSSNPFYIVTFI